MDKEHGRYFLLTKPRNHEGKAVDHTETEKMVLALMVGGQGLEMFTMLQKDMLFSEFMPKVLKVAQKLKWHNFCSFSYLTGSCYEVRAEQDPAQAAGLEED